jgi:hypothetical protein
MLEPLQGKARLNLRLPSNIPIACPRTCSEGGELSTCSGAAGPRAPPLSRAPRRRLQQRYNQASTSIDEAPTSVFKASSEPRQSVFEHTKGQARAGLENASGPAADFRSRFYLR